MSNIFTSELSSDFAVTYPELARARRCSLVVVGVEVVGEEAAAFLRLLPRHQAETAQPALQSAAQAAWVAR